jgi:hypothetical protein
MDWTQRQTEPAQAPSTRKERMHKANQTPDPDLPRAWTGRDDQVGRLMNVAVTDPKEFCTLVQAMLPRPTALQRGLAAHAPWRNAGVRRRAPTDRKLRKARVARMSRKSSFLRTILLGRP